MKNKNYMTKQAKKALMESQVLSRIKLSAPLLVGETEVVKNKIYKVIHRTARFILDDYCFRMSISNIMLQVGWKKPKEILEEPSAKYAHKIIKTNQPNCMANRIKPPR